MDPDNLGLSGGSGRRVVTRKYLFNRMQQQNLSTLDEKLNYMENHILSSEPYTEDQIKNFKHKFSYFKSEIKQRWMKAHKVEEVFLKNNESWLQGSFDIPTVTKTRPGRPCKSFEELSDRSKRRKTEDIRTNVDEELIIHAAKVKLQTSGKRDASVILKEITTSPTRAGKYKRAYSLKQNKTVQMTPMQALSMFVEADLTRRQYDIIRSTNKTFYPCYSLLQKAKQECYPPKESYRVTSTCVETDLQSLIDHTVSRLSNYLKEVLMTLNELERNSLTIICKWGCDGSQQSRFKQKFENEDDSDANIFQSSFVPLRMVCGENRKKIVWQNPVPSSPRFCRPIRFRFLKESNDITEEEIAYVKDAVKSLTKTNVDLDGNIFSFEHIFTLTMVDGKVCNAATKTKSTTTCYVCGVTSRHFNNLSLSLEKQVKSESLEFGLSVLHARIRFLEGILHLAYNLPNKKYRERKTAEEKKLEEARKKDIQEKFRLETGLLLDRPKANFGNTNDGNSSRRFFEDPQLAAEITGISYDLIYRLKVILETISSGYEINTEKYEEYALDTAKLYISLYPWHPMTPTMHKILIHGAVIIKNALLPIGQLSEARNKHFRLYRQNFSRKFSREACNLDIYNRLLLSSDPYLSSIRQVKKRKIKKFLPETIALLMPAEPNIANPTTESDEENISEDD